MLTGATIEIMHSVNYLGRIHDSRFLKSIEYFRAPRRNVICQMFFAQSRQHRRAQVPPWASSIDHHRQAMGEGTVGERQRCFRPSKLTMFGKDQGWGRRRVIRIDAGARTSIVLVTMREQKLCGRSKTVSSNPRGGQQRPLRVNLCDA
jgi:hypothetical protein